MMWLIACRRPMQRGERQGRHPPRRPPHRRQHQQALRHLERGVVEDVVVVAGAESAQGVEERPRGEIMNSPRITEYTPNTIRVTSTKPALVRVGVVVISSR